MQIENHKVSYMTGVGSSVLHGLTPLNSMLDLFVRESIQNSFDAMNKGEDHIVAKFNFNEFDKIKLASYFEGIEHDLLCIEGRNKYISISDYNTSGLVGPTSLSEVRDSDLGKFLNLIRNFAKSNKSDNAGGSYGHGKSNYYKLGIGLVIYYTRIETIRGFEERLMGCVVEQETNKNGLLYKLQNGSHTGIAWWGEKRNGELFPLTNQEDIHDILNCFGLSNYKDNETGTTVIIPYIDENELLNNAKQNESGDCGNWCKTVDSYIKMAMQRWYPTRYANFDHPSGKIDGYIDVYVNGQRQTYEGMYSLYSVIQNIYNFNFIPNFVSSYKINKEEIRINNLFNSAVVGNFYYCLLTEEELKMTVPYNEESPFTQINNSINLMDSEKKTIICFCRKPGMILKYDYEGAWSAGINNPDSSKYLVGMFIPMSEVYASVEDNKGVKKKVTLEALLRYSEGPEHDDWNDIVSYSFEDGSKVDISNFRIVEKIQRNIRNKMSKLSENKEVTTNTLIGSALNKKLAELFLPKKGFGKKPTVQRGTGQTGTGRRIQKSKFELLPLECVSKNLLRKKFVLDIANNDISFSFEFKVITDGVKESANAWEEEAGTFPVEISFIEIFDVQKKDGTVVFVNKKFDSTFTSLEYVFSKKLTIHSNKCYGFDLSILLGEVVSINGAINYIYNDHTVSVSLDRVKGDNDEQ